MLKHRVITALILAACFVAALFGLPVLGFDALLGVVVAVAAWEWCNLSGYEKAWQRCLYSLAIIIGIVSVAEYIGLFDGALLLERVKTCLLIGVGWWAVALLWVQGYPASAVLWGHKVTRLLMGVFVLIPAWLAVSYIRDMDNGPALLLLMILSVVVADTGGYFFGRKYGNRKLASAVSPGKTWAGFMGGLLSNVVLALIVWWVTQGLLATIAAILVLTSLSSVLGDLLESMVKRYRGIKDSGHLLPGHGGVMDRIDGITAAAPVFALGLLLSDWRI